MGAAKLPRRLIVNADDFGASRSINEAVIHTHREGILTTASLMVNGDAFAEAVRLAKANPTLGVGLHLTLVCGKSTLRPGEIPGLVNSSGEFTNDPVLAGMRYFFQKSLRDQLSRELEAQFEKFHLTGLRLDHVNGHLNLHLHPVVFGLLMENAGKWGIRRLRLTSEPFFLNAGLESGRWLYRASHAVIFQTLSKMAEGRLRARGILHTTAVFGLLQNSLVTERYLAGLLPLLPPGDSEVYSHPSTDVFRNEYNALLSPRLRELLARQEIELIRYQDL